MGLSSSSSTFSSFLKAILIPMVFAKFVESIGLGNFLAPKKKTGNTRKRTTKKHFKETVNEQPYEKYRKKSEDTTEEEKERYETMIKQKIAAQFEVEKDAENRDQFAKKQRVWYHNKIRDRHFDDGPEKPYYTIKYKSPEMQTNEDGTESEMLVDIEKQTDPDRLERLEWNAEETRTILE